MVDDLRLLKEDMLAFIDPGVAEDDIEYTVSVEHHNFIRWFDILDRLSAQQREPVVKQLDWIERQGATGTFDASTSIGHYIATITDDDRGMWFIVGQTMANFMQPDLDAVRAAAQADYEQRIMAAIEIIPAGAGASSGGGVEGHARYALQAHPALGCQDGRNGVPDANAKPVAGIKPGPSEAIADVSVDELARLIADAIGTCVDDDKSGVWINCHPAARALLARYRIERLDRLASSGRR